MRRRTCSSASRSRWRRSASSRRSTHVDRLEQLDLLLEGQVGRVAGRVGQRAGLGDRAQEARDRAVVAAQLEDLLDHGAVLALELDACGTAAGSRRAAPRPRRAGVRAGRCAAAPATPRWRPSSATALRAARQPDPVADLGDRSDGRVAALVLRHEQHALGVADVDRQRHRHVREDDGVFQRDQQKGAQGVVSPTLGSCTRCKNDTWCTMLPGAADPAPIPALRAARLSSTGRAPID